jgi:phosphopantetheine adenylyltransferase
MSIVSICLQSLFLGGSFFALLFLSGRWLRDAWAVPFQLFLICLLGGVISIQSLYRLAWLPGFCFFILVFFASFGVYEFIFKNQWTVRNAILKLKSPESTLPSKIGLGVICVTILVYVVWAALPYYRYDQWNYHLVVGKWISMAGVLPRPIADDHVYFTGVYEYFLAMFRLFSQNDLVVEGSTNVFSFLLYLGWSAEICFGIVRRSVPASSRSGHLYFSACFGLIMFLCTPHREALINAKPEALLIPLAFLCTWLGWSKHRSESAMQFLFGAVCILPLAIKVTWIHPLFAICMGTAILKIVKKEFGLQENYKIVLGALIALVLISPTLVKNQMLFGNPLHPVQAIFKSDRFSEFMQLHWSRDNQPAKNLVQYLGILKQVPFAVIDRVELLMLALIPAFWFAQRQKTRIANLLDSHSQLVSQTALLSLAAFALFWPMVGDPVIQPRYAVSILGLVALLWVDLSYKVYLKRTSPLFLGLIVALVLNSNLEVRIKQIRKAFETADLSSFYAGLGAPYDVYLQSKVVNEHRKKNGFSSLSAATVLADSPMRYFFDAVQFHAMYYDYEYEKKKFYELHHTACEIDFMKSLDIRYLVKGTRAAFPFSNDYTLFFKAAEILNLEREVYFLSDDSYAKIRAQLIECQEKP